MTIKDALNVCGIWLERLDGDIENLEVSIYFKQKKILIMDSAESRERLEQKLQLLHECGVEYRKTAGYEKTVENISTHWFCMGDGWHIGASIKFRSVK